MTVRVLVITGAVLVALGLVAMLLHVDAGPGTEGEPVYPWPAALAALGLLLIIGAGITDAVTPGDAP